MGILAFAVFVLACAAIVLPALRSDASRGIKIPFSERLRCHAAAFFRGFADDFRWTHTGICRKHRTSMRYVRASASTGGYVCDTCNEEHERADLEKYGTPTTCR